MGKTIEGMESFISDYIDVGRIDICIKTAVNKVNSDTSISASEKEVLLQSADDPVCFLTEILFIVLATNNMTAFESITIWKQGPNLIEILFGDLFHYGFDNRRKKKNIVVIPVNTAFDTHVSRKIETKGYPIVSENTIHGQWLIRLKESGEASQLDARIENSLRGLGFLPFGRTESGIGKKFSYPIGSIAIIETKNAIYFLIAISEFDKYNNARSSAENIQKAIISLLEIYDKYGQGYDLYLPLMGTGRSRAGLSSQESYKLLKDCLMANKKQVHGQIHLVMKPEDRQEAFLCEE